MNATPSSGSTPNRTPAIARDADGQGDLDRHQSRSQDAGLPQRGENRRDRTDEDRDDDARGKKPHGDPNVLQTREVLRAAVNRVAAANPRFASRTRNADLMS